MKRCKRILAAVLILTCLMSTQTTAAATKSTQTALPKKVVDIINGKNTIYGTGAPLVHKIKSKTQSKNITSLTRAGVCFESGGIDHTHQYIVANAINILQNDKGSSILTSEQYLGSLLSYTDWPDKFGNETDYLTYAGHFYNPNTGKNWLGQTSPTAKSRAVSYFNSAVSEYKKGNISTAIKYIGIGSHYVSDLNEPHHASNLTALNSNHTEFETYVDTNRASFKIANNTLSSTVYQNAVNSSVSDLSQSAAVYANGLISKAKSSSTYYEAGNSSVTHAITNATQYFYKFGKTVGIY